MPIHHNYTLISTKYNLAEKVHPMQLSGSKFVQVFNCLFIYALLLEIQLSEGSVGIPLTGLTLSHFCACLKPRPLFQMP